MKKFLAVLLSVVMLAVLATGCAKYSTADEIKDRGTLVLYTNAAFPPYEYLSNGQAAGVDIDIAKAIAEELGVELEIHDVKFDTLIPALKSGKADIILAGMTVTDERKESVDFSVSYATSVQYIIVPQDSEVDTIEDLAGMKIGVQLGTTGNFIMSDEVNGVDNEDGTHTQGVLEGTGAEVMTFNNAALAALELSNGGINAVVVDKLPAQIVAQNYENFKAIELVYADGSTTDESYAAAVAKGNESLLEVVDKVINELISSGKIDEWTVTHSNSAVDDME
ncbi:MAG: transporter substrate-binding domain-containing protein [Clostridia bacterium]|nr:transporter substrate-binding domain-containing protein [Clostridia bacterium]